MASTTQKASPPLLHLLGLLLAWGVTSSWTDTLNKAILNKFPYPITLTLVHFAVSAVCGFIALPLLQVSKYQNAHKLVGLRKFWPVVLAQTLGFAFTNVSYGKVAIKFAQTVKASAPLFSLAISMIFFGKRFPLQVYLSLLPIILGVMVTASTELTFDVAGFFAAVVANCCFTSRSILGKPFMTNKLDPLNFYHYVSVCATWFMVPVWLATDAQTFLNDPSVLTSMDLTTLAWQMVMVGAFHWTYNNISVLVLSRVLPLTHAICNVMRRVLVIAVTMLYFRHTPSWSNILGMAMVFGGVNWYLKVKAASAESKSDTPKKSQ